MFFPGQYLGTYVTWSNHHNVQRWEFDTRQTTELHCTVLYSSI